MDIKIEDNIFAYKLFGKRVQFPFFIVRMLYLSINIPSSLLYGSIFSEFPRIAQCTLRLTDFVSKASKLYTRMITQGGNKGSILRQKQKAFRRYPKTFFR